jgi:ATP-dependent RNA helicase DeaD
MFKTLGIGEETLKAIEEKGFKNPTPIQEKAIPPLLEGKDLVGQAQTGTGKTAAFGIPIVEKTNVEKDVIQALVLVPTRELALQVAKEIKELGKYRGVRVLALYGGKPVFKQIGLLKGLKPHVVVGTPGRIKDLLERGILNLRQLSTFVLDEADRMLDMGFIEDIKFIYGKTPADKQTLLFSATIPEEIKRIINLFLREDREEVYIEPQKPAVKTVTQKIYRVEDRQLMATFLEKLEETPFGKAIVFTQTKVEADKLAKFLSSLGFKVAPLHGDYPQNRREAVLRDFRRGRINLLVATDVAARGIDISDLEVVFNFRLPQDAESYVHRIGRTGRAGKRGLALSFTPISEDDRLVRIRKLVGNAFKLVNLSEKPLSGGKRRRFRKR